MKSKTYWERRSAERLLDNLKDADKMVNSLRSDYQESILNINESIEKLYGKFATDNAVSYNQAVSLIQGKEYKKWRMSMEKYLEEIAKGDEALSLELNVLCMKKRITRLEAIRAEIYANCGKLARIEEDKVTETLTNALERNYYSSMYDFYKDQDKKVLELMHGHQVALSKANIDRVLRMPWSGDNYSKNIWKSKYQIASKLQKAVTRSILEGKSIENLTRDVSTELGNDLQHSVRRLIHTETAYVKSQGDLLTYDKLGVDEYEFLATLDNRTSSICRSLDGEHFKLEDATPGVNYPPMHPYCRSTTIVYRAEKDGTRAARDDEGETYKVDANLNYKDWYKKYVDGENSEEKVVTTSIKTEEKGYNENNKEAPKTLQNFDNHQEEWTTNIINKELSKDEIESVSKGIKELLDSNEFSMRVDSNILEKILDDGKFKNQFETNTSGGMLNLEYRKKATKELFGTGNKRFKASEREKYGYLGTKDFIKDNHSFIVDQYGDCIIHFDKSKLTGRVTYTVDDSLGFAMNKMTVAGDVDKPSACGIRKDRLKQIADIFKESEDSLNLSDFVEDACIRYIELQYHGELNVDAIQEICFVPDEYTSMNEELLTKLKEKGINLFRMDGDWDEETIVKI